MTTLTSTVPGAITALLAHLANVQANNPSLNIGVYLGPPVAQVENNYITVGDPESGELVINYSQDWAGFPAYAERKSEEYGLHCTLRSWAGGTDQVQAFNNAFTIMDAVLAELQADPQAIAFGGTPLSPSGSWQVTDITQPAQGPLGSEGWGVVLSFTVSVINVRLTS